MGEYSKIGIYFPILLLSVTLSMQLGVSTDDVVSVRVGDTAVLHCNFSHPSSASYVLSWSLNGARVIRCGPKESEKSRGRFQLRLDRSQTTSSLTIEPVLAQDEGLYLCQIYVDTDIMSGISQLKLIDTLSDVQLNWSNLTELLEESPLQQLTVNCSSYGFPLPVVSWLREGTVSPIINSGLGFSTLSFKRVNRSISGRYVCQSDNGIPPVQRKTAVIHVYYPPNIKKLTVVAPEETDIGKQKYILCIVEAHPSPIVNWTSLGYHSIDVPKTTDASDSPFHSIIESRLELAGIATGKTAPREYTCSARNQFGFAERTIELSDDKQEKRWTLATVAGAATTAAVFICVTVAIVLLRKGKCCNFVETVNTAFVQPIHTPSSEKVGRPLPLQHRAQVQDYPNVLSSDVMISKEYLTITEDQEQMTQDTTLNEPENYYNLPMEQISLEPNAVPPSALDRACASMSPSCPSLDLRHEVRFYSTKIFR